MADETYDVVVIGAGPAGSTAAMYAARAKLRAVMLTRSELGGSLALTHSIANYPGLGFKEALSGADLLRLMHEHAQHFGAELVTAQVLAVDFSGEVKQVVTSEGIFAGRTVIITTGAGSRPNKLPGEEEFLGRGVSYCATCDAAFCTNQDVAVVGSGEEAVEEALVLTSFARTVHFVSPAAQIIANVEDVRALQEKANVVMHMQHTARAIRGEAGVESLLLHGPGGNEIAVPVYSVFIYLPGNRPATDFLRGAVALDDDGYVVVGPDLSTSVPGVYAAGDVRGPLAKQVVLAAADGCLAALSARKYLHHQLATVGR